MKCKCQKHIFFNLGSQFELCNPFVHFLMFFLHKSFYINSNYYVVNKVFTLFFLVKSTGFFIHYFQSIFYSFENLQKNDVANLSSLMFFFKFNPSTTTRRCSKKHDNFLLFTLNKKITPSLVLLKNNLMVEFYLFHVLKHYVFQKTK